MANVVGFPRQGGTDGASRVLAKVGNVRAWDTGDYILVACGARSTEAEFKAVVAICGCTGRTDYEVAYDDLTGYEFYRLPQEEFVESPLDRCLRAPTSMIAGMIGTGIPGILFFLLNALGH